MPTPPTRSHDAVPLRSSPGTGASPVPGRVAVAGGTVFVVATVVAGLLYPGYDPTREQIMELNQPAEMFKGKQFFYCEGCDKCNNLGFKGRTGLYELLVMDDDIRYMVSRGASTDMIRNYTRSKGTESLRESGLAALLAGTTTLDEVVRETVIDD